MICEDEGPIGVLSNSDIKIFQVGVNMARQLTSKSLDHLRMKPSERNRFPFSRRLISSAF